MASPDCSTPAETEAEAVAFVVCQAIGLETGTAGSDYIQLFDGKAETLATSLDRIQRTAAEIIAATLPANQPTAASRWHATRRATAGVLCPLVRRVKSGAGNTRRFSARQGLALSNIIGSDGTYSFIPT